MHKIDCTIMERFVPVLDTEFDTEQDGGMDYGDGVGSVCSSAAE